MPSNLFKGYQGDQVGQVNILPSVAKINEMLFTGMEHLGAGIGDAIKKYSDKIDLDREREAEAGIETTNPVTQISSYYVGQPDPTKGVYDQISTGYKKYIADTDAANEAIKKADPKGKITAKVTEEAFHKGSLEMFKNYTKNAKNINPDLLARWNEGINATDRVLNAQFNGENGAQIENTDYERANASNVDLALGDIKSKKGVAPSEADVAGMSKKVFEQAAVQVNKDTKGTNQWETEFANKSADELQKVRDKLANGGAVSRYGNFFRSDLFGSAETQQSQIKNGVSNSGALEAEAKGKYQSELSDALSEAHRLQGHPWTVDPQERTSSVSYLDTKIKEFRDRASVSAEAVKNPKEKTGADIIKEAQAKGYKAATGKDMPTPESEKVDATKKLTEHFGEGIKSEDFAFKDAVETFTAQEKTWQEKRVSMQKYMVDKFGGVPANFDEYFYKQHPEAAMSVVNLGGHDIMLNRHTGAMTELTQLKGMDSEEMGKFRARQFGLKTGNKTDVEQWGEYVPNSGLEVKGEALGTSEKVGDLRIKLEQGGGALQNIDKMLGMMDVDGRSMSPEMIGQSKAIQVALLANLRALFEKGVRITQWSNNVLKDASGNPTDFVSLDALTKPRLEELKQVLAQEMQNAGVSNGIAVRYNAPTSKDTALTQETVKALEARKGK